MWECSLDPTKVKKIGKMIRYRGPMDNVFRGRDSDLEFIQDTVKFTAPCASYPSSAYHMSPETVSAISLRATAQEGVNITSVRAEQEVLEYIYKESSNCASSYEDVKDQQTLVQVSNLVGTEEEQCLEVSQDVKKNKMIFNSNAEKSSGETKRSDMEVSTSPGTESINIQVKPQVNHQDCLYLPAKL